MSNGIKVYPLDGLPDGEALMVAPGGTTVRVTGFDTSAEGITGTPGHLGTPAWDPSRSTVSASATPAAMLGEALELVRRAAVLTAQAGRPAIAGSLDSDCGWLERAKREAEAREGSKPCGLCGGVIGPDVTGRPMCYGCGPQEMRPNPGVTWAGADSCWQCDRPLGTGPDACLACAAKRAEDRAKERRP